MPLTALIVSAISVGISAHSLTQETKLTTVDTAAAFKAAGYKPKGKTWMACAEGKISEVRDINGDGMPEVVISESGTECHGMTGEGYSLLSKQSNGAWKLVSG